MSSERQLTPSFECELPACPTAEALAKIAHIEPGRPDTFGATPLDHSLAYDQQQELNIKLQKLVESDIPEGISDEVAGFMAETFAMRFQKRAVANHENFLSSLHPATSFADQPEVNAMILRAKIGHASPAEVLLTRELLGIRSAELACLTHPYGKNIDYLEPMRASVRESVEALGGVIDDEPTVRYRVKNMADRMRWEPDYTKGLFMTRKRDLGIMPDGTMIRERSSFILRGDDERALPGEALAALKALDATAPGWEDRAVQAAGLDAIAKALLETEAYNLAIPVSTTIYAFNPETTADIDERDRCDNEQRRIEIETYMESKAPLLLAHIALARANQENGRATHDGRVVKDIDGMVYIGPEYSDQ